MKSMHEIQSAVSQLARKDLGRFRKWFEEFDLAEVWDAQFEEDVHAGRLDAAAEKAISSQRVEIG